MKTLGATHQNLDQKVYDTVKAMIIARQLKPGTKILQDKLAQKLGVSRTPLVNALKKLEHEHLIKAIPRRGFFVRLFSRKEMADIFQLREVLEGLAARKAATDSNAQHIEQLNSLVDNLRVAVENGDVKKYAEEDRQFHNLLVKIGGKEFLSNVLDTYNILTLSYQFQTQEGLVRTPVETLEEHRAIVDAIRQHNPLKSEEVTRSHLSNTVARLLCAQNDSRGE